MQKIIDEKSDGIRKRRDQIRALQSQIEILQQDKRILASLRADHVIDIDKLSAKKWDLIRERRALNA